MHLFVLVLRSIGESKQVKRGVFYLRVHSSSLPSLSVDTVYPDDVTPSLLPAGILAQPFTSPASGDMMLASFNVILWAFVSELVFFCFLCLFYLFGRYAADGSNLPGFTWSIYDSSGVGLVFACACIYL